MNGIAQNLFLGHYCCRKMMSLLTYQNKCATISSSCKMRFKSCIKIAACFTMRVESCSNVAAIFPESRKLTLLGSNCCRKFNSLLSHQTRYAVSWLIGMLSLLGLVRLQNLATSVSIQNKKVPTLVYCFSCSPEIIPIKNIWDC